jgi:hypothetical protein
VSEEVEERKEDAEGLLHSQKTVEWPFAMELHNGLLSCDTLVGYDVLAGIIAFGGAVPEEELVKEG